MERLIILIVSLILALSSPAQAADFNVDVRINDVLLAFDSAPFIYSDRTMVPVRAIAESLGAEEVQWDAENKIVRILLDGKSLVMIIGERSYLMDNSIYDMDVAPMIAENRTMVPLRFVAEAFGCEVTWNDALRTVEITKEGIQVEETHQVEEQYTPEDLLWLARIVHLEGYDIGDEAKLAIANVVLNRVKGDEYPDTVYDVIMDDKYAVQFPPAHRESFKTLEPSAAALQAAKSALEGNNNIDDCLYFNYVPFKSRADDLYKVIDGEYFYH